jgi:hypothetical protein
LQTGLSARAQEHLGQMVRSMVEETLNAMLYAEADQLCGIVHAEPVQGTIDQT